MGNTKKVKSTGRFGSRYGVGIRKRVLKVEEKQKQRVSCPHCSIGKLKRISRGVFICSKCEKQFAGGAFVAQTLTGGIIRKMVNQKSFLPLVKELLELKEGIVEPDIISTQEDPLEEHKDQEKHKEHKGHKKE